MNINIQKEVYNKTDFIKVNNVSFSELSAEVAPATSVFDSVEDFFTTYDNIFDSIPNEGGTNSHRYILKRESDYLGVKLLTDDDLQLLLQEITDLRKRLVESETNNIKLSSQIPLDSIDITSNQELLENISNDSYIDTDSIINENFEVIDTFLSSINNGE